MVSGFHKSLFIFSIVVFFSFTAPFSGGFFNASVSAEEKKCECESGPCCDGCDFLSEGTECYSRTEYRCLPEKECGGIIQHRKITRSCDGESAKCPDKEDVGEWKTKKECCHLAKCQPKTGIVQEETKISCEIDEKCPPKLISPNGDTIELFTETTPEGTSWRFLWEDLTSTTTINQECGTALTEPYINSYYFQVLRPDDKEEDPFFYWLVTKDEETDILNPYFEVKRGDPTGEFFDSLLTKKTTYKWQVAGCPEAHCKKGSRGEFSPPFEFTTGDVELKTPNLKYPLYDPGQPEKIKTVNFGTGDPKFKPSCLENNCYLSWEGDSRTYYYQYQIKKEGQLWDSPFSALTELSVVYFKDIWRKANLGFDATSTWRVKSCWGVEKFWGTSIVCEDKWSEEWKFKTTGAIPTGLSPADGTTTTIPVILNWDNINGALSYRCEIATDTIAFKNTIIVATTTKVSELKIGYPDIKMEKDYYWRVSSCADENGENYGTSTNPLKFTTLKLPIPSNPSPKNSEEKPFSRSFFIGWENISWARAYQYHLDYIEVSSEETDKEGCKKLLGPVVSQKTVTTNADSLSLQCLGNYQWSVRACLGDKGQECGDWREPLWTFTLTQYIPQTKEKGLIPCGKDYDSPETAYNERQSCGIQHIFLMLQIILNVLLFRLAIIFLVTLSVIVGLMSYFSLGSSSTLEQIKSLLKSAAVGWLVMFLAWMFINYLLSILGFQVTIFGHWWQLPQ